MNETTTSEWIPNIHEANAALVAEQDLNVLLMQERDKLQEQLSAERERADKNADVIEATALELHDARRQLAAEREAAKKLCEIYFNIAAEAVSEDEVRSKRDAAIAAEREKLLEMEKDRDRWRDMAHGGPTKRPQWRS